MREIQFIRDDYPVELRKLVRSVKLRIDPRYRVECQHLATDPRVRKAFFSRNGVTIDELGELLLDRGLVSSRPCERDVLDVLDEVFVRDPERRRVAARERRNVVAGLDANLLKASRDRGKKFECADCGQIAYASRNTELACAKCSREFGTLIVMQRVGQTLDEALASLNSFDWTEAAS